LQVAVCGSRVRAAMGECRERRQAIVDMLVYTNKKGGTLDVVAEGSGQEGDWTGSQDSPYVPVSTLTTQQARYHAGSDVDAPFNEIDGLTAAISGAEIARCFMSTKYRSTWYGKAGKYRAIDPFKVT
jgi:hypothetical protein